MNNKQLERKLIRLLRQERKQKMKQPTNKELLEIVAILAELSLQIVKENRAYWNYLKNPPETRGKCENEQMNSRRQLKE